MIPVVIVGAALSGLGIISAVAHRHGTVALTAGTVSRLRSVVVWGAGTCAAAAVSSLTTWLPHVADVLGQAHPAWALVLTGLAGVAAAELGRLKDELDKIAGNAESAALSDNK